LVFNKNAIFFAENYQKSQKIVIITSTPDFDKILNGLFSGERDPAAARTRTEPETLEGQKNPVDEEVREEKFRLVKRMSLD
jgi:hypothetical protein